MKSFSIRHKLLASFGSILLVLVAIAGYSHVRLTDVEHDIASLDREISTGSYQTLTDEAIMDSFASTVRHILHPEPESGITLQASLRESQAELGRIATTSESRDITAADRQLLTAFVTAMRAFQDAQQAVLVTDPRTMSVEARASFIDDRLQPAFKAVAAAVRARADSERAQRADDVNAVHADIYSIRIALIASIAAAFLIALASGAHLLRAISRPLGRLTQIMDVMRQGDFTKRMEIERRDEFGDVAEGFNRMADEIMGLVGQVQKSGIRVSTSMTEIAATSKQQQATAAEIAATTTEIGATSREISATSKELVRTMNEVSSVAEHASGLASSGQAGLMQMEDTMGQVMDAAGSINAKLAVLNEKASNINQVVTTITKVADQTNLLSLNAAIEAEKAGEYGRGFAVVSSEIRRLADQTAVATFDIEETVKEIQAAVSAGVMGMDKFSEEVRRGMRDVQEIGGKLSEVIAQVQALVPRFEAVNDGMQAQAAGAEQISEALLQLTETTRQTVESLRQSNSAIDELKQVSGSLHGSIAHFRLAA